MSTAAPQASIEALVKQTLDLSREDQVRFAGIIAAIATPSRPGIVAAPEMQPPPVPPEPSIQEWLRSIAGMPALDQLQLLDDALERTDAGADTVAVQQARKQLLDNHPPVAVRASVTRLVEERPVMALMGVIGLGFGAFALLRGLFRAFF